MVLRTATVIDAPHDAVVAALADAGTWRRAVRAYGGRLEGPTDAWQDGDRFTISGISPLRRKTQCSVAVHEGLPVVSILGNRPGTIAFHLAATPAGVLTRLDVELDGGKGAALVLRQRVVRAGQLLLGIATLIARESAATS